VIRAPNSTQFKLSVELSWALNASTVRLILGTSNSAAYKIVAWPDLAWF